MLARGFNRWSPYVCIDGSAGVIDALLGPALDGDPCPRQSETFSGAKGRRFGLFIHLLVTTARVSNAVRSGPPLAVSETPPEKQKAQPVGWAECLI